MKKRLIILLTIILILLLSVGCSNNKRESKELIETGITFLASKDYEDSIEYFKEAIRKNRNKDTLLALNMAEDYIKAAKAYDDYLDMKEARGGWLTSRTDFNDLSSNLYISKDTLDNFCKKYKEYVKLDMYKSLEEDVSTAVDTEHDRLLDLLELNLSDCTSPKTKEIGDKYIREFDTRYLSKENYKRFKEIKNRYNNGNYYTTYLEKNLDKLIKKYPNDWTLIEIKNDLEEEKIIKEQKKNRKGETEYDDTDDDGGAYEPVTKETVVKGKKPVVVREAYKEGQVPLEYCTEFDTSLANEIACDFYQTDNIEILSSGLEEDSNGTLSVLLLLNGNLHIRVYVDGRIVEYR